MRNVYKLLRVVSLVRNRRIRLLGIWVMHILKKRYIGIFIDPVLACNFRCRMCYFSDAEKRKNYRGVFRYDEIERIARSLFGSALKLQIGCGAEPTLHKELTRVIALGKQYKIPYISLTTNGSLLSTETVLEAAEAGLNEITLSVHGIKKETYEYMMTNGRFDRFRQTLQYVGEAKTRYPDFKLRINYTMNPDNFNELSGIWELVGNEVDILQLRPIQRIGNSEYANFDLSRLYNRYDAVIAPIAEECKRRNITFLAPAKKHLRTLHAHTCDDAIEKATYCYISPRGCWKDDFDYRHDTFASYARKHHIGARLFAGVFAGNKKATINVSRKMNYCVN